MDIALGAFFALLFMPYIVPRISSQFELVGLIFLLCGAIIGTSLSWYGMSSNPPKVN